MTLTKLIETTEHRRVYGTRFKKRATTEFKIYYVNVATNRLGVKGETSNERVLCEWNVCVFKKTSLLNCFNVSQISV